MRSKMVGYSAEAKRLDDIHISQAVAISTKLAEVRKADYRSDSLSTLVNGSMYHSVLAIWHSGFRCSGVEYDRMH